MYITAQTLITAGAVLGAIISFVTLFWKLFRWIEHQKEQDGKIEKLEELHCHDRDNIQEEQTLMVYGLLACLKGLKEKGCNGPVTEAIDKIEKHLNLKAHGQEE